MKSVFCFGELLLRLSPVLGGEWIRSAQMPVFVGGAELNVAQALALWGIPARYSTALPDHYLSDEILEFLQEKGLDLSGVHRSGARIGTYYLPKGADLKAAGVIYDRAYSSFYSLKPGQIDWDTVLEGAEWFHFSAISPALNADVAAVCKEGLQAARSKGLFTSVDLNYRAKLWQWGKQPGEVLPELVSYCNLVMGNIWAAEKMLNIPLAAPTFQTKEAHIEAAAISAAAIRDRYPECRQVANTFRFDRPAGGLDYYATLSTGVENYVSVSFGTDQVIDRVGSGDCFMAGLIYANLHQLPPQEIIDFAAAAAFTKLFITGDATTASVASIQQQLHQHG